MAFLHQERHQRRRQQRGPYTTKACTNCQQKHANRGPKKIGKHPEQVYALNGPENDFDGTSMLSSVIPNHERVYTSTLSFSSEYLQRQPDNFEHSHYSNFYEDQNIYVPQEISPVSYQTYTDTRYIIDNMIISFYMTIYFLMTTKVIG
ncbi:2550_t:CDS:2 [Gigaspora margarita]|uniref:2550_t:CDS:1 n=1 Tax=Gigaspora margarita TaxID=4874 RepID=A0ABN7UTJ3_GIGMA|nr:2550_t:CDS:2 [Gigaspora margarita]